MPLEVERLERQLDADASRRTRWLRTANRIASDRHLARRASRGDRRAIAAIFERYQQELYGFCLGLLGEPQDAQDALQNTMVKVLRALPGEEREIALRPWLYRIARNEAVELRRSRYPTQTLEGHLVDVQASVTERAEQREQLEWLLKDLGDLPERQRTVLVMRELSGLDFAEIGAALDTSGAVVRQALYEARRNLGQMDRGRGLNCEAVTRVLSDADGRITRRRDIRAHLRDCPDCQRFRDAIRSRKGVLATVPPVSLPVGAAAGVAQALLGGSGGGGSVAALAGGVAQSVGAAGALKAAGTVAAVALIGTATIHHGEMRSAAPDLPPRPPLAQTQDRSLRSASPGTRAVLATHAASGSYRPPAASKLPAAPISVRIFERRARSPRAKAPEPAFEAAVRPSDLSQVTGHATSPPEAAAPPGVDPPSKPEKSSGHAQEPESKPASAGSPVEKGKTEHPPHPSEGDSGQPKTTPGQAKKQASAETQMPSSAPPAVEGTVPAATGAEALRPAPDPGPNGKAKGHEK